MPVQLSSPPATPDRQVPRKRKNLDAENGNAIDPVATPKRTKRAKKATVKVEMDDDLPHNLGPSPQKTMQKQEDTETANTSKRRAPWKSQGTPKLKQEVEESVAASPAKRPKTPRSTGKSRAVKKEEGAVEDEDTPKKKAKAKNSNYGLTPGQSPYPNWPHPTPEECEEVVHLLSKIHGKVQAPKTIPPPSLTVTGCGEVPSVLDALIRTRLSAATTNLNSGRAFKGLVEKFGVLEEGIGKGSVNWNKVRLADQKDIFEAIKSGGLADVKSKDIKKILQMVWEENQARGEALESADGKAPGSGNEPAEEKNVEVQKAAQDVLSLDHLHLLSSDDAFNALVKYPGIGPKTASCVLLFCLQRPSFAVDTHVFRLCKWLGWVPPPGDPAGLAPNAKGTFSGANRNSTYAHCDVRIPDEHKYALHYLLIKHGKTCPRCRAITGESSEGWDKGCVIDHLVVRTGGRKDATTSPVKKGKGTPKKKKVVDDYESEAMSSEVEAESPGMSDLVSDAEIEASDENASSPESA